MGPWGEGARTLEALEDTEEAAAAHLDVARAWGRGGLDGVGVNNPVVE